MYLLFYRIPQLIYFLVDYTLIVIFFLSSFSCSSYCIQRPVYLLCLGRLGGDGLPIRNRVEPFDGMPVIKWPIWNANL
jgi:hypothetical protein